MLRKSSNKKSRRSNKKRTSVRKLSRKSSTRKSVRRSRGKKSIRRKSLKRTTMKMPVISRFIHFGCWNNGGCDMNKIEKNNLTNVMIKLNEVVKTQKDDNKNVDFLIISGDNYYPSKKKIDGGKKIKTVVGDELKSGFECLPKDVKKYILLGNHELEKIKDDCEVLSLQQEYSKENNIIFQNSNSNELIMNTMIGNEDVGLTLIIMLDTTMYDDDYNKDDKDGKIEDLLFCYKKLDPEATIKSLQEKQEKRVSNLIQTLSNRNIKNVIVVGHHPIMSGKTKEDKGGPKTKIDCMNLLLEMYYKSIYLPLNKQVSNFYYFCADLHLYQTGIITYSPNPTSPTIIINQYVSGTGGAELDDYKFDNKEPKKCKNSNDYNPQYVIQHSKKTCGFMDCIVKDDGSLDINFHEVVPKQEKEKDEKPKKEKHPE